MNNSSYNDSLLSKRARGFPRFGLTRPDRTVDVVVSKLIAPTHTSAAQSVVDRQGRVRPMVQGPDMNLLDRISEQTASNIVDSESLFQLLPDTELAKEVVVSSILSPKDLVETKITYTVDKTAFPSELAKPCLDVITEHFDNVYKMSEKAPDHLRDALFKTGSYAIMVLPESSIDHAINSNSRVSHESIGDIIDVETKMPRSQGILGNPGAPDKNVLPTMESWFSEALGEKPKYLPAFENLQWEMDVTFRPDKPTDPLEHVKRKVSFDPLLTVTDNPQVLRIPALLEKSRRDRLNDVIRPNGLATEAFVGVDRMAAKMDQKQQNQDALTQAKERGSLYRDRQFQLRQILTIDKPSQLQRESVGHPLDMHLPSECVIPVHVPSSPEKHLGYFVLLDRQGNPLVKSQEQDYYHEMSNNLKSNRELVSQLTAKVKRGTYGSDWYSRQMDVDEMTRIYSDMVQVGLAQRLQNGLYREGVQVANPQEIYRIMLARALAGMHTQLLYVPAELMTYIAFDYNQYGVGVSLMQKSKVIGGLRAMLLFADTMAAIKNSVGRTIVSITLDEQDPDPASTVEGLMHEFAYARSNGLMPLGATSPRDIVNYMQQASVEYVISGNPRYPSTAVNVEDRQNNRVRPDDKLQDDLKKRHLNSFGLAPETVDAAQGPDFATSVVANNLLMAKRVLMWQKIYTGHLQDFVARFTLNSGILLDRMRDEVKKILEMRQSDLQRKGEDKDEKKENVQNLQDDMIDSFLQRHDNDDPVDAIILDFIHALRVELPKPEQGSQALQMEAFEKYNSALETALKAYMTPDFLREMEIAGGEEDLNALIEATKAFFMRDYMRTNRIFPELEILTQADEDGPALNMQEANAAHVENIRASMGGYITAVLMRRRKYAARIESLKAAGQATELDAGPAATSGGTDTGMDTGGDTGGDGLNFDDDLGMDTGADTGADTGTGTDEAAATEEEDEAQPTSEAPPAE